MGTQASEKHDFTIEQKKTVNLHHDPDPSLDENMENFIEKK